MGDEVAVSRKERMKLVAMEQVAGGRQTLGEAAVWLGMSYRQVRRVWRRYREAGVGGLVHRSRGRPSNRRREEMEREAILAAYRARLEGFGPTLASEKLAVWGHVVDHETLRRWLRAEGLWQRRRRRGPHRRWREPKRRFGELVQMDGSHHDWLGCGALCCLMSMVDDATGRTMVSLEAQETTGAAMRLLWRWIERYGVPGALYVDGKTVYVTGREPTAEEQLAGEEPLTAFGKACRTLGIRIILAHSAAAKGRVERKHGVFQDRFVKELKLQSLTTIEEANAVLEGGFVEELNRRFGREPLDPVDGHRPLPRGLDLAAVFVVEVTRTVANDWTIRHGNRWYQITGPTEGMPRPRAKVTVQRRLDGSLHLLYREHPLTFREVPLEARVVPARVERREGPKHPVRPRPDHPWYRPFSPRVLAAEKTARVDAAPTCPRP